MNTEKARYKYTLSIAERIDLVTKLAESYFLGDTLCNKIYRPDYARITECGIIAESCIEGIEYQKEDYDDNGKVDISIEEIENNCDLIPLISEVKNLNYYKEAIRDARSMVEHEKLKLVHRHPDVVSKIVEYLDKELQKKDAELNLIKESEKLARQQSKKLEYENKINELVTPEEQIELAQKMADSGFDTESVATLINDKFFKSTVHEQSLNSVIQSKTNQIRDLQNYKATHDVKN